MDHLEKVLTSKTDNINRKNILIPLAIYLDIDHTLFKNRKLLIEEIKKQCTASKLCENSEDFITLCPIDLIPKERLFIWNQNNKTFGCDIVSLKKYIDSGKTINPWTIDFATGIEESLNREQYLNKFDMKKQKGLLKKIQDSFSNINYIPDIESTDLYVSINHKLRFDIETIGDNVDQYVTHLIDCSEKCDLRIFLYVVSDTLKACMDYFILNNDIQILSILEHLFIHNEIMKFNTSISSEVSSPDTLSMLLDLLNVFISQKENIYADGIIKYFFLEFEESLKAYNLLVN